MYRCHIIVMSQSFNTFSIIFNEKILMKFDQSFTCYLEIINAFRGISLFSNCDKTICVGYFFLFSESTHKLWARVDFFILVFCDYFFIPFMLLCQMLSVSLNCSFVTILPVVSNVYITTTST